MSLKIEKGGDEIAWAMFNIKIRHEAEMFETTQHNDAN